MPIRNILYLLIQILNIAPAHEHLGGVAVVVVEEDAATCVECFDLLHVLCAQREVVEHEVLSYTLLFGRAGNDDDSSL